jgi:hypothetical protein
MTADHQRIDPGGETRRRSIFPQTSERMRGRPSKRMSANDNEFQQPTDVRGELPVSPHLSQEQAWQRKIHRDLHRQALTRGDEFWPHNRVVPEISWAPEPSTEGEYEVRLFADVFIRPRRIPSDLGTEWTESADLISRTVLQPAGRVTGVRYRRDFPVDQYFDAHYRWLIYWSPTVDCDVVVRSPVDDDSLPFRTLDAHLNWPRSPSGPLGLPFLLRRGAEDDPVVLKRGTLIARLSVTPTRIENADHVEY